MNRITSKTTVFKREQLVSFNIILIYYKSNKEGATYTAFFSTERASCQIEMAYFLILQSSK